MAPAIAKLLGLSPEVFQKKKKAILGCDLPENDQREDYLRAILDVDADGKLVATPYSKQDSAMLAKLAKAQVLVIRPPFTPAAAAGEVIEIVELPSSLNSL